MTSKEFPSVALFQSRVAGSSGSAKVREEGLWVERGWNCGVHEKNRNGEKKIIESKEIRFTLYPLQN